MWKDLVEFLADIEANPSLRAHRDFFKDHYLALEQKMKEYEAAISRLMEENGRLSKELSTYKGSSDWIETRGVLLKKAAKGGVEPDAYCKYCRRTLFAVDDSLPLRCAPCNFYTAFTAGELDRVRRSVSE